MESAFSTVNAQLVDHNITLGLSGQVYEFNVNNVQIVPTSSLLTLFAQANMAAEQTIDLINQLFELVARFDRSLQPDACGTFYFVRSPLEDVAASMRHGRRIALTGDSYRGSLIRDYFNLALVNTHYLSEGPQQLPALIIRELGHMMGAQMDDGEEEKSQLNRFSLESLQQIRDYLHKSLV